MIWKSHEREHPELSAGEETGVPKEADIRDMIVVGMRALTRMRQVPSRRTTTVPSVLTINGEETIMAAITKGREDHPLVLGNLILRHNHHTRATRIMEMLARHRAMPTTATDTGVAVVGDDHQREAATIHILTLTEMVAMVVVRHLHTGGAMVEAMVRKALVTEDREPIPAPILQTLTETLMATEDMQGKVLATTAMAFTVQATLTATVAILHTTIHIVEGGTEDTSRYTAIAAGYAAIIQHSYSCTMYSVCRYSAD
jgi:hypothetical protein